MEHISHRHEGDLGGRLAPFATARPVEVAVVVTPDTAGVAATQHTAWMLINLLARAIGIVTTVRIVCPPRVSLAGRVVPLADRMLPLRDALVTGGRAIGAVPVCHSPNPLSSDMILIVGAKHQLSGIPPGARHITGEGWWGGVGDEPLAFPHSGSDLPFGPYIAACFATAEIFLHSRLPEHAYRHVVEMGWDCWSQVATHQPVADAPSNLSGLTLPRTALAGVGAVGTAWMHTVWATKGVQGKVTVADADRSGVTTTNLNRCTLFGIANLGAMKAPEAARIANDATVTWDPHSGQFEELSTTPTLLVSAVDTNHSRSALQNRYAPLALSGSTRNLRAEVLRVGPPGVGACLRCFNPPEPFLADDDLRRRLLGGGESAIQALAAQAEVSEADVRRALERPACNEVGDRILNTLRRQTDGQPSVFAVGFTSVMAGTLLAAETIKLVLPHPMSAMLNTNNVTFQFLQPTASCNAAAPLGREPRCPACAPDSPATRVWQQRLAANSLDSDDSL